MHSGDLPKEVRNNGHHDAARGCFTLRLDVFVFDFEARGRVC